LLAQVAEAVDEVAPDLAALGVGEVFIVEGQLDTGAEGFVEGADTVRG
jgi:hypothetical protein